MLVVWGRSNSINVQKALWCCEELALAYRRIEAGGRFGVVDTPEYRSLNPNGLVPTIDDEGFVLWESHAIVRYLAAKHGAGSLCPMDPKARAVADQWMDWKATVLWPAFRTLFVGLVRTPPAERDQRALEASRVATGKALAILDAQLARQPFVAGDGFSMGDIPLGCAIWRWLSLPIERPALAHVQRWADALALRPAYRDVVMQPLS
jgi:glutathione S-transferase